MHYTSALQVKGSQTASHFAGHFKKGDILRWGRGWVGEGSYPSLIWERGGETGKVGRSRRILRGGGGDSGNCNGPWEG